MILHSIPPSHPTSIPDGGKIEVWDIDTRQSVDVIRGPSKGVTCLYREDCRLYCGDTAGSIAVWNIADPDNPDKLVLPALPVAHYPSEADNEGDIPFYPRCVRCITAHGDCVYWGDDGTNVKVLNCTTGEWSHSHVPITLVMSVMRSALSMWGYGSLCA